MVRDVTATIRGVLFDKDGTLFDFKATWNAWARATLLDFANGDIGRASELGALIGYDFATAAFDASSEIIAGTPDDLVRLLSPGVPELSPGALLNRINATAAAAPQMEAVPLAPLFAALRDMGMKLGVATNDAEAPARAHLESAGQGEAFDFVAGYDSGYGGKPAPGMCLGFAQAVELAPAQCVMVGDSTHDLLAGRAAGMSTIAVLTGMADAADLSPLADAVLPDIGHLPDWLKARA